MKDFCCWNPACPHDQKYLGLECQKGAKEGAYGVFYPGDGSSFFELFPIIRLFCSAQCMDAYLTDHPNTARVAFVHKRDWMVRVVCAPWRAALQTFRSYFGKAEREGSPAD